MRYYGISLIIICLFCGCSNILSKDAMADILIEIHWSDAILYGYNPIQIKDSAKIYNAIFERHQTNFQQFENSLRYYSRSAILVKDIYKTVHKELASRSQSAQSNLEDYLEEQEKLRLELVEKWVRNDLPFAPSAWQYYSFYPNTECIFYEKNCSTSDISNQSSSDKKRLYNSQ